MVYYTLLILIYGILNSPIDFVIIGHLLSAKSLTSYCIIFNDNIISMTEAFYLCIDCAIHTMIDVYIETRN